MTAAPRYQCQTCLELFLARPEADDHHHRNIVSLSETPASFLPPPRKRTKSFDDVPLIEAPETVGGRAARLAAMEAEALAENPNAGRDVPWRKSGKGKRSR